MFSGSKIFISLIYLYETLLHFMYNNVHVICLSCSSAPEIVGLLSELNYAVEELESKINPVLSKVKPFLLFHNFFKIYFYIATLYHPRFERRDL